jgi:hypothetical protein
MAQKIKRRLVMLVFDERIWTATMTPQYDIFRVHNDGTAIWLEPANTLDAAHARMKQLGATERETILSSTRRPPKKSP